MALLKKKTAEEQADAAAAKAQQRLEDEAQRRVRKEEQAGRAFAITPAGQARAAFWRGDHVFQYSVDVMRQDAIVVHMMGSTTSQRTTDPGAILNSVCLEGWELINGSFVFVEQGEQSRDKFMSSGQNVAIKGKTIGFYLFRRCEQNRRELPIPVEEETSPQGQ